MVLLLRMWGDFLLFNSCHSRFCFLPRSLHASLCLSDDLDSLLGELSAPPKAAAKVPAKAAAAPAKVAAPAPAKQAPAPAAPKKTAPAAAPVDDLDALLSDLGSPAPAKTPAPKKVAAAPAAAPKKTAPPASGGNDLDDLLKDLSGPPKAAPAKTGAPPKTAAPAPAKVAAAPAAAPKKAAPPVDDLDALMADLGSPAPKKPANPPAKTTAPAKKADDLEALMADLQTPTAAAKKAPAPAPAPKDELDDMMAVLQGKPAAGAAAAPKKGDADLDDLMSSLQSGNGAAGAGARSRLNTIVPPAAGQKKDDLDDLMSSLAAGSATRSPVTSPTVQRAAVGGPTGPVPPRAAQDDLDRMMNTLAAPAAAPANRGPSGSVSGRSRMDSLVNTVSGQMNDFSGNNTRSRGTCAHCRLPIYEECMQAMGRAYHPEHFVCGSCQNPIGTGSFFELEGLPHCERCYQLQFCPRCAHCNQPIMDRCVTAMNRKWHVQCFVCTQCTQPFDGTFLERDGRPYCERCFYSVFAPRCRACNQPVMGDCINALGSQWHPEHFTCQFCHKAFTGTFFEYEGLPYCEVHYYQQMGTTCGSCNQPITGASVDAMGKKFHPEHFTCTFCMNPLAGGAFSEKNAKPYCKPCYSKLFQ